MRNLELFIAYLLIDLAWRLRQCAEHILIRQRNAQARANVRRAR